MQRTLRQCTVDTRTVPAVPDREIEQWLGTDFLDWPVNGGLVVRRTEGRTVYAEPGHVLVRWPDGELTVNSPLNARLMFGD